MDRSMYKKGRPNLCSVQELIRVCDYLNKSDVRFFDFLVCITMFVFYRGGGLDL